jgi:phosphohistidine swiveling domain-containing protein
MISSGESDDPIFSIVNTLFTTVFGRRLGTTTDGTTKRTSLQVRTGEDIDVSDDHNAVFSATTRDLDLKQDITLNLLNSNRNFNITARGSSVNRGYAYVGPSLKTINRFALSTYSPVNGIELEEGTGAGEIVLEDGGATSGAAVGSIQLETDVSFPVSLAEYDNLKFTGTGDTSVDGESVRLGDISGELSTDRVRTNLAFPCEITSSPT